MFAIPRLCRLAARPFSFRRSIVSTIVARSAMDSIKSTIAENLTGNSNELVKPEHRFTIQEVPSQKGKVGVITGGSDGIGYAVVHTLLSRDISKLFIISLSKESFNEALDALKSEFGAEVAGRVEWMSCDIGDWPSIVATADKITKSTDRLDILFNNAGRGIMTYQLTDFGVDRHMAANHFGHVLLTSYLLPLMSKTADAGATVRIVNQSSNLHESSPSDTKFQTLEELNQDLGPNGQYARSKLAVLLYARWLARHVTAAGHPNLLANATHPGVVDTKMSQKDIHEPYPLAGYGMSVLMKPFKKTPFEGALSALFATTVTEQSGQYICPPAVPENGSDLSNNEELGEQLMKLTAGLIREKVEPSIFKRYGDFKMS